MSDLVERLRKQPYNGGDDASLEAADALEDQQARILILVDLLEKQADDFLCGKEGAHTIAALRAENEELKASLVHCATNHKHNELKDEIANLRAENEAQKAALRDQLTARKHNEAEIARLKELYSEQVQRADKYFIDSQRLRAALETISKYHECGLDSACAKIARAALDGETFEEALERAEKRGPNEALKKLMGGRCICDGEDWK